MSATITFNDGAAATLQSAAASPGDRFGGWLPDVVDVGPRANGLGDGIPYKFVFRTDYVAAFEVRHLTSAEMAVAHRLIRHLTNGGTITVNTDDASTHSYTCRLREGTLPRLTLADAALMEWTLMLQVRNASAAALICEYGPGS